MSDNSAASNLPAFTPMTLTPLPVPEALIPTAASVIEATEGINLTVGYRSRRSLERAVKEATGRTAGSLKRKRKRTDEPDAASAARKESK